MEKTSSIKQYFKKCFEKKLLIEKAIIAAIALAIVLIFSLSFYFWLKDKPDGVFGQTNGFWYIEITWNHGVGFGGLNNKPGAIYAVQSLMFILLLAVYLLLTNDRITCSFIALAMFGGLFNLIQRATSGNDTVLDYFRFGFWPSFAIFNWPDMFVVIGIFGFIISYITLLIIQYRREKDMPKEEDKPLPPSVDQTPIVESPTTITAEVNQ